MLACIHCQGGIPTPSKLDKRIQCARCKSTFQKMDGVWDFRLPKDVSGPLSIYQEDEFQRWLEIFGTIETKNWKIYDSPLKRFFSQAGHRILSKKLRLLPSTSKVVEIGPGTGELLNFVKLQNYIGIDTNWGALCQMAENHPDCTLICTSGEQFPIFGATVDVVVSLHTLEHIYYIGEFFEEVRRVLKADGVQHFVIPAEGGIPFAAGRALITGPHLRSKYDLDVEYIMDREHINDAPRVLKFLRMYFKNTEVKYWPIPFLPFLNFNAMIYGKSFKNCSSHRHREQK